MIVHADAVAAQPWRNGGGQTRELLAWPAGDAWRVRISRADIDHDGPFSAFPQVQRWFAVLQGAGVVLQFADGERTVRPGDEALAFDGAAAPGCRLIDGPTQDLNLMLRGMQGALQAWRAGQDGPPGGALRALYTTVAGHWQCGPQSQWLDAHALLWSADNQPTDAWQFTPARPPAPGAIWWISAQPQD
jgi:environmental stress-induced protein Ves